ncbi:Ribulose-phosphate 3-epimerase [subsurface metagenome]
MDSQKIKIAPSILSADFARLGEQIAEATKAGAHYIHVDVMDGHFVPVITIGAPVVKAIRPITTLPLDVHLMIERPEGQIEQFAQAGADIITVHAEVCPHLRRVVESIKERKVRAGVSLNPATPLSLIDEVLPDLDLVLLMTVNPGFAGQAFIEEVVEKIARMRRILDEKGLGAELEVDGGITAETAPKAVAAGARVLVAGSAIFCRRESVAQAMDRLRASLVGFEIEG